MKKFSLYKTLVSLVVILLAASCSSPRKLAYLRDMEYNTAYEADAAPDLKMQPHDILEIAVFSTNPQLSDPFNTITGASGTAPSVEYIIDSEGDIDFPILGTLHVEGLTTRGIRDLIAGQIDQRGYIKNPVVKVTLKNFTVTVVGRTNNKIIKVDNGSINLFQVIAQSGELGATSNIRDVMVVRTENGERQAYTVNLQSKDLFSSPVFFLQQNDIVYIKPKGGQISSSGNTTLTFVQLGLSVTSIIMNYIIWGLRR